MGYDFVYWLFGDVENCLFSEGVASFFLEEVERFVEERAKYVVEIALYRKFIGVEAVVITK